MFDFDESSKADLENSKESAKRFYSETVMERVELFLRGDDEERLFRGFVVMAIGVAAFFAFTQCNFTGLVSYLIIRCFACIYRGSCLAANVCRVQIK